VEAEFEPARGVERTVKLDASKAFWVICLTLFIVVGVNAAIYVSVTRRSNVSQIDLLRRAAGRARNPWENEDRSLQELGSLVQKLKDADAGQEGETGKEEDHP